MAGSRGQRMLPGRLGKRSHFARRVQDIESFAVSKTVVEQRQYQRAEFPHRLQKTIQDIQRRQAIRIGQRAAQAAVDQYHVALAKPRLAPLHRQHVLS